MALFQILIVTAMALGVATPANSATSELDRFRWKNRVLLIFAADADTYALLKQRQLLGKSLPDVGERDMVIVEIIRGEARAVEQPDMRLNGKALEQRFAIGNTDFKVVLIGKDGGSKLERETPIDPTELFRTIDAMPMRQSEMR